MPNRLNKVFGEGDHYSEVNEMLHMMAQRFSSNSGKAVAGWKGRRATLEPFVNLPE